jgi:DNA-binding transcriptional MerR regulator
MFIQELSQLTGVTAKAIRYYESLGLMPLPRRADNNYRVYTSEAVERLRFIIAIRTLDLSLTDIAEFLEARDSDQLLCHHVLNPLEERVSEIDRRIADLLVLRETLNGIRREAQNLPLDRECNEQCVCYLLTVNREDGQLTIQKDN